MEGGEGKRETRERRDKKVVAASFERNTIPAILTKLESVKIVLNFPREIFREISNFLPI